MSPVPDWPTSVTAIDIAKYLGVSPRTLRAFLRKHRYPPGRSPNDRYLLTQQQAEHVIGMWRAAH